MTNIEYKGRIACPPPAWPGVPAHEARYHWSRQPKQMISDQAIADLYAGQRYENYRGKEILSNYLPARDSQQHLRQSTREGGEPGHYVTRGGS